MKKVLVVTLVILMGVAALALAGCGGQTKEAKEQMKTADAAWDAIYTKIQEASASSTKALTGAATGNTAGLDMAAISKLGEQINSYIAELENVSKEYEKMLTLKGVDKYLDYASAMIKTVDANIAAARAGLEFFNKVLPVIISGDMTQIAGLIQANAAEITKLQQLEKAAEDDLAEAKQMQTDNKLK